MSPRAQRGRGFPKAAEALAAPELFRIDPVATFDFAVLLRGPGPGVAVLDPPACWTVSRKSRENSLL